MVHRAWACAGTALLVATAPHFAAFAQSPVSSNPSAATLSPTLTPSLSIVPALNPAAQAALQKAIAGNQRIEPARDRWRNPAATLQFFGVRPTDTVIEVWPGQGWYTSILGPYLKQGGGSLIVGHFDASSTNSAVVRQIVDAYRARFASDQTTYGSVSVVPFGPRSGPLGLPGTADSVLTFRNIHNWMAQGWAEKAFGDFFLVLKPGGILGIEEHRGRTDEPQDPLARDGYVREDFVIQLAREAGFEFIGRSEINANPADTKDHPFGVWTLPPVSRSSAMGQRDDPGFDRTRYNAIGESDRMTLRFRKPLNATSGPPAPGTRWSPVIVAPAPPPPPIPTIVRPSPPISRPPAIAGSPNMAKPVVVTPPVIAGSTPSPRPATPTPSVASTSPSPPSADVPRNSEAAAPRAALPVPASAPVLPPPAAIASPTISPPVSAAQVPNTPEPASTVISTGTLSTLPPVVEAQNQASTTVVGGLSGTETEPPALIGSPATQPTPPATDNSPIKKPVAGPSTTGSTPASGRPTVRTAPPQQARLPATRATRPASESPNRPVAPSSAQPRSTPLPTTPQAKGARPTSATTTPTSRPSVSAAPTTPTARAARPAVNTAPAPKAKAKAPAAAAPRPPSTPPPLKKKPAPTPDPNKPDWVVPRQRS